MRLANLDDRLVLIVSDTTAVDVEHASAGRFGPDPQSAYDSWDELVTWAATADTSTASAFDPALLGAPVPRPRQVFAIGLNYAAHAAETGASMPPAPNTFTKFPTCLVGPYADIELVSDHCDWEVELVAVIAKTCRHVALEAAWSYVAGLTVGQDISERVVQRTPPANQFNLGKSFATFGPTGPWLVTPDELPNRDDLALSCAVGGETLQSSRTSDLIFSVPATIAYLSEVVTLLPGDIIFTGTPSGVGTARKPPRYLQPGEVLESTIEGIGTIRNPCVQASSGVPTAVPHS